MYSLMRILSVRRRVLLAADGDGGDGADGDGADRGGAGGRPEEAGHRHLPRPRPQLSLQLLGEKERNSSANIFPGRFRVEIWICVQSSALLSIIVISSKMEIELMNVDWRCGGGSTTYLYQSCVCKVKV